MRQRKRIQDLTMKDNFMFGAVMLNPDNCKGVLERALGIEIEHVEVSKEKSIVYNPEYKGVRLDIYAKDEKNTHYNIEMQVLREPALNQRARYYHSQIDMELLTSGLHYSELPDTYVIFICDFDPFGLGKYRYTQMRRCKEVPEFSMEDGEHTIFLSTKGRNDDEVPKELVDLLKFVGSPLSESEEAYDDAFIRKLQTTIQEVKGSREMGARYMTFQELLDDERALGREEGIGIGREEGIGIGREEGIGIGREEGIGIGRTEGRTSHLAEQVQKKLAKHKSIEQIAEELEEDVSTISEIVEGL